MDNKNPQIFINYSIEDNKASNNKRGWVESFSHVLSLLTSQILKSKTEVTLLEEIDKPDSFLKSDIFINIISENYLTDKVAKENDIKFQNEKSSDPVFNILKSSIKQGYEDSTFLFFSINSEGNSISWDPEFESDYTKEYWLLMVDLAYEIVKIIKQEKSDYHKTVFIAETHPDQKAVRDAVKRDLKLHGYQILPAKKLTKGRDDLKKELLANLEKSDLSIHLLSEKYGDKVIENKLSIVDYQNKVASEYCIKNPSKLKRIIWISPDHRNTDMVQNEYLEHLRRNKEELAEAELVQTPLELLKSIALAFLNNSSSNGHSKNQTKSKKVELVSEGGVYIIHDAADKESVKPMLEWFKKNGQIALTPDFELRHDQLMIDHKQKLIKSDSVVIFCDHGNVQWSKTKIKDLIKSPGFGRNKPFKFKCLYIASERNLELEDQIAGSDYILIKNTDRFSASMMSPLLSNVK